ncbi:MAG: biotin synthase BioB [Lachnospiraceae bacterium]|nr:biotin synthase BioB [Lachnospiraceae bacterium]
MDRILEEKEFINELKTKVINGYKITKDEAYRLMDADLDMVSAAADKIREFFQGNSFDMCSVLSVKGGKCSENCKFCSQSCRAKEAVDTFDFLDPVEILSFAKDKENKGLRRMCLVSSGRVLSERDIDKAVEAVKLVKKETNMNVCVSFGLLNKEQLVKLKAAGVTRVHNNLETSEKHFPDVCTSHTYQEKRAVLKAVQEVDLSLCSGGIIGIGETMKDRIDMAFDIREYEPESVPVNILKPVKGTFFENATPETEASLRRTIAIFKFILPHAYIRIAAGRDTLPDRGRRALKSGANAAISGDMLTVSGVSRDSDYLLLKELGYENFTK